MATIKDVSRLAGVSISTVSRVINRTAPVTLSKKKAVLNAMKTLDFTPNTFAQALVRKRSDCIGILLGDLCGGSFFTQMMRGIERVVSEANMFTMMVAGYHQEKQEQNAIDTLRYRQCDALIIHSRGLSDEKICALVENEIPVVLINRYIPQIADHCVWFDTESSTYLAVEHLVQQGHTYIAFVNSDVEDCPDAQLRQKGFLKAVQDFNLNCSLSACAFPDERGGYHATKDLLFKSQPFTAVVAFNDMMASGILGYLWEHKFRVPEDISVVGCDNTPYTQFTHPKLTTINYPIEAMGTLAAQLVLQKLQGKFAKARAQCFHPSLVLRDSVTQPRPELYKKTVVEVCA